ncbi:DUF3842 family protein [Clostridium sp. KNHs216]|uniref:DUF3842 family protein n=1 Tax=Clostridium sp. KNHs216 TaxID=1550235 RepID=UPI0011540178|nr:DUF3842 family protein [Clostridium sp. KNHs216]MBE6829833.1 DUF3842 family protein [Oscillospiraceae bacterium]TQI67940.1 uncharacterized protein DUF3842 [Clostridium sp. KNHs216]
MKIIVIDGQGGGIGRSIVERLKAELPGAELIAVGTNALATSAMLRAGADAGATGENAAVYNCAHADIIAGPMGIILANAMLGEISPAIAQAVSGSKAEKVLVPVSACHVYVAGVEEKPMSKYIEIAVASIRKICEA